jgi:hypothetical protein
LVVAAYFFRGPWVLTIKAQEEAGAKGVETRKSEDDIEASKTARRASRV